MAQQLTVTLSEGQFQVLWEQALLRTGKTQAEAYGLNVIVAEVNQQLTAQRQQQAQAPPQPEPEPDPPIWTPRIYAVVGFDGTVAVRSVRRNESGNEYLDWDGAPAAGEAVVAHTYASDGVDVISDAVARVATYDRALAEVESTIWDALDPEFRVLVVSGAVPS